MTSSLSARVATWPLCDCPMLYLTMDLLVFRTLFGTVADLCGSAIIFTVLSVISLLTYFDILESFGLCRWLFKTCKPGIIAVTSEVSLYSDAERKSSRTLSSIVEKVMLLESNLCTSDSQQCHHPMYRKKLRNLLQEINLVDDSLWRLAGQCGAAERDQGTGQTCAFNKGTERLPHPTGGGSQQKSMRLDNIVTSRDRQRIQLLHSKLHTMKTYTEERLKLLTSFANCLESYQLCYCPLRAWVMQTHRFQEWIHTVQCESELVVIRNLGHQKRIVEEIEEKALELGKCSRAMSECVRAFEQIKLQAAPFKQSMTQRQPASVVKPELTSTLQGEMTSLRQQFLTLVRITKCHVTHLRGLLYTRV